MDIKVVIDLDDDLETIHPLNPAFDYYNPEKHPTRNWKWVMKACGMADVVTATTESLLEKYAQKTQGFLIPNCIPERFLDIQKTKNELITVGYAGHTKSHPNDLQVTHGAINEAIAKQEARFMAIGGGEDVFNKLGIRNRAPHKSSPPVDFDEYPNAVAQLDIGIVPLADTFFNECKSWLKTLEYAALGVAPVISPTRDNMRMIELGGAYMARNPKEWRDNVRTLINNEEERLDLVKRARAIAADWTIEANAWRWKEAWCGTL
jgi:glycosyltransferase involved in cell wall biosynthesis